MGVYMHGLQRSTSERVHAPFGSGPSEQPAAVEHLRTRATHVPHT